MNRYFLLILELLSSYVITYAQESSSGTIIYNKQSRRSLPAAYGLSNPVLSEHKFILQFDHSQSLWQSYLLYENEKKSDQNHGMNITVLSSVNNNVVYHNFQQKKRIDESEIDGKTYLVNHEPLKIDWKQTGESSTHLGYKTFKATANKITERSVTYMENGEFKTSVRLDTLTIVAWFAPKLNIPTGPAEYQNQLPGIVLELNINNGSTVYKAEEVSFKKPKMIRQPSNGTVISAAAYKEKQAAYLETIKRNLINHSRN